MPVSTWTIIILDRTSGVDLPIDVTSKTKLQLSEFQPTAQRRAQPSHLIISFPSDAPPGVGTLIEGEEWWAGYRFPNGAWDATKDYYAGYVGKQTGKALGKQHRIEFDLDEYDILLTGTDVITWPDPATPGAVLAPGFTVADYLVGNPIAGTPYLGLLPARLGGAGGVELDGVDAALARITFNADGMPGMGDNEHPVRGGYGFCSLRQAIDDLAALLRKKQPFVDPVAFMEPAISTVDPTQIRPRFRFLDQAATPDSPIAAFSVSPGVGEWAIEQPFAHERDNRTTRQRVVVRGNGTEGGQLIYAIVYNPSRPINHTKYQTDPGWAGAPYIDPQIGYLALAMSLATTLEERSWGAEGRLSFQSAHYVSPGSVITLYIPQEGQFTAKYRIIEARAIGSNIGRPIWQYTVGDPRPDLNSLIQRIAGKAQAERELAQLTGVPAAPHPHALSATPVHSQQNVIQAQDDTTHGLTFKGGYIPPGSPTSPVQGRPLRALDRAGVEREWIAGNTGTGHPHHYGVGFGAPGTALIPIPDEDVVLTRTEITAPDGTDASGAVTLVLLKNNVAVANPPSPAHLLPCTRRDVLSATLGGAFPAGGCTLLFSEAPP